MMNYVIIDDEKLGVEVLHSLITNHYPPATLLGKAYNLEEGLCLIEKTKPDVVFLDIVLQGNNGFDLLSRLSPADFKVVFVTSYNQYALQAIKFSAFDYLLKPVLVEELLQCITKLEKVLNDKNGEPVARQEPENQRLFMNERTRLEYVNFTEITYLKGDGNYTHIYTDQGKENYTAKTLKEYDEILCVPGSGFLRIHKSYIVNMSFIRSVVKSDNIYVILKNGEKLEVSRRKKSVVIEQLKG
jgi:two-component system LytT family response regulator